jgi:hypothetical protein
MRSQKLKYRLHALGFAGFILACVAASPAPAQSLTLSPAILEAQVRRGATYANSYTLLNRTNVRLRVHCSLYDYWYDEQNQRITGRPGTLPHSASTWVQFSASDVIVEPNASASVKFVVSVPQDAAGGYYTSPTFEAEAADVPPAAAGDTTSRARIKIRFHGLLLLTTTEATEYNVEIMGVKIAPPTTSSSLALEVDVRNRSTAHTHVAGAFALLDSAGKLVGRGNIKQKRFLPGERNKFNTAWTGELSAGRYLAIITITYDRVGDDPATVIYQIPFSTQATVSLSAK